MNRYFIYSASLVLNNLSSHRYGVITTEGSYPKAILLKRDMEKVSGLSSACSMNIYLLQEVNEKEAREFWNPEDSPKLED